jgi:hypothetical protein
LTSSYQLRPVEPENSGLIRVHSWLKINQNELKYAKQTQIKTKSNIYNASYNNDLQRKMQIGHLVKTNPIKANFTSLYGW